ncbi:transcription-repair coupling factor [Chloroflexota bacterium]
MNLSGLLAPVENMPAYKKLVRDLGVMSGEKNVLVVDSARPCLIAALYRSLRVPVLVITARSERARQLHEEIPFWLGDDEHIRFFPEPDALPYERLSSDSFTVQQRLRTLSDLAGDHRALIGVASAYAAARKTVPAGRFAALHHTVRKGSKIDLERTLAVWLKLGYEMEKAVELPGSFSRRGGILDIYSPDSDLPARIELLGNEVESIRLFDPSTQRSLGPVPQVSIIPAREMIVDSHEAGDILKRLDLSAMTPGARERLDDDISLLAGGHWFDGLDFYTSVVNDGAFLDYWPENTLVVLDQTDQIQTALSDLDAQARVLSRALVKQGEMPAGLPVPYFTWPELAAKLSGFDRRVTLEQWGDESMAYPMSFSPAPGYTGNLPDFLRDAVEMAKDERRVTIVSQQAARLSELFGEQDTFVSPVTDLLETPPPGSISLVRGSLAGGWRVDYEGGDIVFSDAEVFGFVKKRRMVSKRPAAQEALVSQLAPGDYVVHVDHGIGRFAGLTRIDLEYGEREYLVLEYAATDKLYVPTDQADRVSRYIGPGGYTPALSRLGTQEWIRTKQRVKEAADNLAGELLTLYSTREVLNGLAFSGDTVWQQEMEGSFPYLETPDQLRAVQDVKHDMEQMRPMDRLVCGDVGYGKTEVAIRAAFKAVMDGMQVAVLVPTTVLAQQHLTTFNERLSAFPVNVQLLSRFRSPREQQEVIQGLADGSIDICIGTHRLIQKDVSVKNLGLVVIDEEQRFGVTHKERLKQLRSEVDVLTLSATPIPRTLHMSLIGIRDMSTMETPPQERHPIKSYVSAYNDRVVREAILRELERGGQVFYLHNRVRRINWVARKLSDLVPEARIGIAHGQMPEDMLESVMLEFTGGRVDILVCTTIIESGLDLPNVNTLIIDDADRMGLTQLYQLRGRVGRGTNRAYAYFFYSRGKELTDAAQKRLRTILEASELGAGYRIAMRDLEIRGAGNLLGPEQSGHMGAVGFELYNRLLSEAITGLKASRGREAAPEPVTTTVDLPVTAFIPEDYVPDLGTRMDIYVRLAGIDSLEGLGELGAELEDRFGPLSPEAGDLLYIVRIKLLGGHAGVQDISSEGGQVVIRLRPGTRVDRASMQERFGDRLKVGTNQLRFDTRRAGRDWKGMLEDVIRGIARVTEA